MAETPARDVFVGRQRELVELKAALDDALSGQGRVVMLAGEPGIGKTRISRELATQATLRGAQVLWGRCHADQGAPPYWPWVQVIRSYVHGHGPEQVRSQMGPGAADIAEVVPEVRECVPDLKPPPALEPEGARFRLFDSITAFLKQASQSQPLVVVLDNLHWADKPSLSLLEFLAQEMAESRLLLVGTYRDVDLTRRHSLTQTLGELTREPLFRRVLLRGLGEGEVGQFIQATSGFTPPRNLVRAVHTQTEGNPLFMTEVVRLLAQEGELVTGQAMEGRSWSVLIPAGVREVIGRRLDRLSDGCNQVLGLASVIGREFELRLLERLMEGMSGGDLLEAVEEALAARVIEEVPNAVGRYQFTHVLIQDTLAGELSAARRARLHGRIGEALEERYGPDESGHAAELAHHFAEAAAVIGNDKMVHYSLAAGERSLATYAYEEALDHFQGALAAKGVPLTGSEPAKDGESAALLFSLGRAQAATLDRYQMQGAVDTLRRAFDYYTAVGDVDRAVAVAGYPVSVPLRMTTGEAQLIARALKLVPSDSHQAGRLLCRSVYVLHMEEGDYDGAQEASGKALAIAQRERDVDLEMRTLGYASQVDFFRLHWQESLGNCLRAIELARRVDDSSAEVAARYWATIILLIIGDLERAQVHAAVCLAVAERLRDRYWLANVLLVNVGVSRVAGNWKAARQLSDRGLGVEPRDARLLPNRALLDYEVGDLDQGKAHLERLLEVTRLTAPGPTMPYTLSAIVLPLIARITGVADQSDVAEAAAETVLASPSVPPFIAMFSCAGLGLLAVQRGDVAAAEKQYAALKSVQGTALGLILTAVDRLLGLLSRTMGNLDKAAEHFEDALTFCRKAGYRPELAWSCYDYADCLLLNPVGAALRGRPGHPHRGAPTDGNRRKATALLDEALAISGELGMRPLMERVMALQEKAKSLPAKAPAYPDGLTQREVEVLRLIAAGKTDREIAEELVISIRTVGNHVSNILNKTNTVNRTEAATYAARHGLA